MEKRLPYFWMTLLIIILSFLRSTTALSFPEPKTETEGHALKKINEPCDVIYSQAHCSDDDEDYPTGHVCDLLKTDNCNRSLELFCFSGVCHPNCHPQRETYNPEEGKCFRKVGADCKNSSECEKNAICEGKQCRCANNFAVEPETGKCVRAADYGEYCDHEINCDKLSDIECINNRCDCKSPEKQYYNSKRKRCYIYIGNKCTDGLRFCPDDSNCLREIQPNETVVDEMEEEHYIGIPLDDEFKTFKCKCDKNYAPSVDGKSCTGLFGSVCNSLHKCNTERSLKCQNGTCQCARPSAQMYDEIGQKCLTLAGQSCSPHKERCVDWAECTSMSPESDINNSEGGNDSSSKCECVSGFMPTPYGLCLKGRGQRCKLDIMEEEPLCNIFAGLECSNLTGDCQCKDWEQFFDMKLQVCRNFEVAPKNVPSDHGDFSDREYNFHLQFSASETVRSSMICFKLMLLITVVHNIIMVDSFG